MSRVSLLFILIALTACAGVNRPDAELSALAFQNELAVAGVSASSHDGNVPENTLDRDLTTRWSAQGDGENITFELQGNATIDDVAIAWHKGDQRTSDFTIQVSTDGTGWFQVFSGTSSGSTLEAEIYPVTDVLARFVRIVGFGNSENDWNSITEVHLLGSATGQELSVSSVVASSDDGNVAANTLDRDYATRWSAQGDGENITFTLSGAATVDELGIAWHQGDQRVADFQIQTSSDGSSWAQVHAGSTSGTTLAAQMYDFADVSASHVRIVGFGNTVNDWNSITEVFIFGSGGEPDPEPTATLFVSPSGSDGNSGTSEIQPLATIQRALELAQPGDVIKLADGEYFQDAATVRDGLSGSPIVVTGSRNAIVRGGGMSRIFQVHHDHIHLRGFTIDGLHGDPNSISGYRDKLIYSVSQQAGDGVTGLRITGMMLRNAGGEAVRIKYLASDIEIADNEIIDAGIYDFVFNDGGKNGEGVYIGTSPSQLNLNPDDRVDTTHDVWIHHNFIDVYNEGVNTKEGSHDVLIEYNTVTGSLDEKAGGVNIQGEDNVVRYNEIHGVAGAGVRLGESTGTGDGVARGVRNDVHHNRMYEFGQGDSTVGAVKVQSSPQGTICGNDITGLAVSGPYASDYDPTVACPSDVPPGDGYGHLAGR
jgi:hypothetical protein